MKLIIDFIKDWQYHTILVIVSIVLITAIWFVVDKNHWLKAWQFEVVIVPVAYIVRYYLLKKYWRKNG